MLRLINYSNSFLLIRDTIDDWETTQGRALPQQNNIDLICDKVIFVEESLYLCFQSILS
jgi:hypothetical protein